MKLLIEESRRDRMAKNELDQEFSNLYEDVNYQTDSAGKQMIIHYNNGDGVIMIYGSRNNVLYVCEDIAKPIIYFSYTPQEVKRLIGEWFSDKFELPVKIVQHVHKSVLR
jgi:hypothetical protein